MITIDQANNGYILKWYSDDAQEWVTEVYEVDEWKENGEETAAVELLWNVVERLGVISSKHDKYRVFIAVDQNDTLRNKSYELKDDISINCNDACIDKSTEG